MTFRIPAALQPFAAQPRWVVWRLEMDGDKPTKRPYQANAPSRLAKVDHPSTWSDAQTAIDAVAKHGFDGIGICLQGYEQIAFDIDHCRDPTTGEIDPWALALVKRADSYCEITPSKTGLRIIGHGSGKRILRKQSVPQANGVTLESYRACEKYITVTGDHLEGTPETLNDFSALMDSTVAELDAAKGKRTDGPGSADDGGHHARQQDDDELWQAINEEVPVGQRSERVWWVINEMFRRGYGAEPILAVLLDKKNRISAHIYDQGGRTPRAYAQRQIDEAKSKIGFSGNEHGVVFKTPANICVALLRLGIELRYDSFADRILINGLPGFGPTLEDAALDRLWLDLGRRFRLRPSQELLRTVVSDVARSEWLPSRAGLSGWSAVGRQAAHRHLANRLRRRRGHRIHPRRECR